MRSYTSLASLALLIPSALTSPISNITPTSSGPIPKTYNSLLDRSNANTTSILASSCTSGSNENTADITAMGNWLQGQSGTFYLPHLSQTSWTLGSIRLCVNNDYLSQNTHVSFWEAGWGALSVKNACCFNQFCGGGMYINHIKFRRTQILMRCAGNQQGHGDSGLSVNIVVKSAGENC